MSRTAIAFIFLIICLISGIFSLVYVEKSCNRIISTIEQTESAVIKQNTEKASENFAVTVNLWETKRPVLNIMLGKCETSEVHKYLNNASYFYKRGDLQTALTNLQECKEYLKRIIICYRPTLSTIL